METVKVPVGLVRLIHEMAKNIKLSHGGWWESYASSNEIKLIKYSEQLKK